MRVSTDGRNNLWHAPLNLPPPEATNPLFHSTHTANTQEPAS